MSRIPRPAGSLLARLQAERGRVDAVAQPGRRRAVREQVAQVGVAAAASHLDPPHAVAVVLVQPDVLAVDRLPEARPAGARVELGAGVEQRLVAADAVEDAVGLRVPEFAREGTLG